MNQWNITVNLRLSTSYVMLFKQVVTWIMRLVGDEVRQMKSCKNPSYPDNACGSQCIGQVQCIINVIQKLSDVEPRPFCLHACWVVPILPLVRWNEGELASCWKRIQQEKRIIHSYSYINSNDVILETAKNKIMYFDRQHLYYYFCWDIRID